jgi:hypothetical protein
VFLRALNCLQEDEEYRHRTVKIIFYDASCVRIHSHFQTLGFGTYPMFCLYFRKILGFSIIKIYRILMLGLEVELKFQSLNK